MGRWEERREQGKTFWVFLDKNGKEVARRLTRPERMDSVRGA